ncbi:Nitrate reductase (NAD(P)H) [Pleurostoma richardsiae]|uniref:Nitrate reductase (NAD(P)H) n=1 Tax=Pleurostoma richardsiae TaxID=41990 RepID=A0AA38R7S0_9PEZI|nr:Nitrate reductase (NAD(P)H) [Pleurostoma richardsiae]
MGSMSKLSTAILAVPNELTVAAANFNLDFSLMKVEAPKEFHGVRDALSSYRRNEAEEGQPHVTARKLGALFEAIVPPIPNLTRAYGTRASDISSRSKAKTQQSDAGIFTAQAGIDGTSIWAAATSGRGAFAVHLLACMLARIWKSHEAISLWVELVDRRRQDINDTYNNGNATEIAAIMASGQAFSRQQLASWDSSARSWLRTADADRRRQQTQLMLIINNVRVPVNAVKDPYNSVIKAWTSAMCAMELLVQGIPQRIQDGAVLLAMSSWHLYANMEVLVDEIRGIDQDDELMNGGFITISAHGAGSDKEGVFWSLPLSRMRYYSPPVTAARHVSSETSQVSLDEFWIIVLGIVVSQWDAVCPDVGKCCRFIASLSNLINQPTISVSWLKYLADAAANYTSARSVDRCQAERLLGLGMRRCRSFLNDPELDPPSFFGLGSFPILMSKRKGSRVRRYQANAPAPPAKLEDLEGVLANASLDVEKVRSHLRDWWGHEVRGDSDGAMQQSCSFTALVFATELYSSLSGATVNIETVKQPLYEAAWAQWTVNGNRPEYEKQPMSPVTASTRSSNRRPDASSCSTPQSLFGALSASEEESLSDEQVLAEREKEDHDPDSTRGEDYSRLAASFACIAMFETGEFNIDPGSLQAVMALSTGDSIYVASDLVSDPSEKTDTQLVRRVLGNLGRPEIAFLVPPSRPMLREYDLKSWHLINHLPFDGKFEDNFSSTSLYLSFTDFEMPLDVGVRGLRDNLAVILESLVSVDDKGEHLGDLDIMSMLHSRNLTLMRECLHQAGAVTRPDLDGLISIDSWVEFFDLPRSTAIVRAYGNWQARLAIATASVQLKKRTLVLPQNACLQCLQGHDPRKFDVIVA